MLLVVTERITEGHLGGVTGQKGAHRSHGATQLQSDGWSHRAAMEAAAERIWSGPIGVQNGHERGCEKHHRGV